MTTRTTPGATAPGTTTGGRGRRALAGLTAATLAATAASVLTAGTAFAAVPTAPDNLLVFPNRDFVTIEGYQSHKGEVATIEVTRAGKVVGSAQGTVSGDDVAFEVNHPGGVCWGAGTGVNVTPDIVPGDLVTIKFGGTAFGDTTVQSAGFVNDPSGVPAPTMSLATSPGGQTNDTLIVEGTIDPANNAPDAANMEQRIVNPDGFRTNLGKRDIRAVPGPLTASPKAGTSTYSSKLDVAGDKFTATYVFSDPAVAQIAKDGGGQRLLSWQLTDAAANRQGVTIAEAGELGGPGFGGCPAGPAQAGAPAAGSASVIRSTDKTSAKVTWTPATAQPGAEPVSGYSIEAIPSTAAANGEKAGVLVRTPAGATSTTVGGLTAATAYDFEIRSMAGTGMSPPFTVAAVAGTPTGTPPPAGPAKTVAVTPKGGVDEAGAAAATSVTATAPAGYQVFYTDDGSLVAGVDGPSNSAKLYGGPIPITKAVQLHIAAWDPDGNLAQTQDDGWYAPGATVPTPTGLTATAGQGQATLKWNAVTGATGYQVVVYTAADGSTKAATQPPAGTGTQQVVTGLAAGDYWFAVSAKNVGGAVSPESTPLVKATVTGVTDTVTIGKVTWKAGQQLRVTGSDTLATGSITILPAVQDASGNWVIDTTKPALISNVPLTSAAPAAGSTYDARGATTQARPAVRVIARSSGGGVSTAVAVP
jgi:Fibronectin type III domain